MRRRDAGAKAKERQPLDKTDPTLQRFLDRASTSDLEANVPSFAPQFNVGFTGSSNNYEAGESGWHISENGDAEFNNVTVRGSLYSGSPTGAHIVIAAVNGIANRIDMFSGEANETNPPGIVSLGGVQGTGRATGMDLDSGWIGTRDSAALTLYGESSDGSEPDNCTVKARAIAFTTVENFEINVIDPIATFLSSAISFFKTVTIKAGANLKKENFGAYVHHDTASKKMVEDGTDAFTWPGGVAYLGRTVTFPTAFSAAPRVYCQYRDAGSTDCIVIVRALSATQFTYTVVQKDAANVGAGVQAEVMWFATGNPTGT